MLCISTAEVPGEDKLNDDTATLSASLLSISSGPADFGSTFSQSASDSEEVPLTHAIAMLPNKAVMAMHTMIFEASFTVCGRAD